MFLEKCPQEIIFFSRFQVYAPAYVRISTQCSVLFFLLLMHNLRKLLSEPYSNLKPRISDFKAFNIP